MAYCGQCEKGCWVTCQPVNGNGYCRREIQDAQARRRELEGWIDRKGPTKIKRIFGKRVGPMTIVGDIIVEEFGPRMILEDIWS